MKMEPGTYDCKTEAVTIEEFDSGAVMFLASLDIGLRGALCLIQKDGTLSERGFKDAQTILGWTDWDWDKFSGEPTDFAGLEVSAVVETVQGDRGEFSSVKYLNPPGGGQQLKRADAKTLAAKYGAKTRALLGGTSAPPPPAKPKAPPPSPPPTGPTSTMEDAWAEYCKAGNSDDADAWYGYIKDVTGKEQNDCTPQDWGKIVESVNLLPY